MVYEIQCELKPCAGTFDAQNMVTQNVVIVFLWCIWSPSVQGRFCYEGFDVKTSLFDKYLLNVTKCKNPDSKCVAGDVNFKIYSLISGEL